MNVKYCNAKNNSIAIVLTLLFLSFSQSFAQISSQINSYIIKTEKSPKLEHSQWSLFAKYVDGQTIIKKNSNLSLAPASGLKLVTTAAALNFLGENFQFETGIYTNGKIINGVLKGDVYLKGSGDPTLGSDQVDGSLSLSDLMTRWVDAFVKLGIKELHGDIIADDNIFDKIPIPGFWYWTDIGNYFGTQTSGLSINDNLYYLYFKPAKHVGDIAKILRTEPDLPELTFINHMKTGAINSGDNGYIFRSPTENKAVLRGTIPQGFNEFSIKGSLPNPPLFAANTFQQYLENKGIKVFGYSKVLKDKIDYSSFSKLLVTHSPQLKYIVRNINKTSNNFYTEQLLKMIGLKVFGEGSTENGIKAVKQFLTEMGINISGINIYDGSGLSRSNMITSEIMAQMLEELTKKSFFNSYWESLSIAGNLEDDGTFKTFGLGTVIANNARIKSGFISNVRSHSGYVKDANNRLIVFSFIANNFLCDVNVIDKIHKNLITKLAELK